MKNTTTLPKTDMVFKNVVIDTDNYILYFDEITKVYNVIRAIDSKTGKEGRIERKKEVSVEIISKSVSLTEISLENLRKARFSDIPSFVLKENGKYYYGVIPSDLTFRDYSFLGGTYKSTHLCAASCSHMSAAKDELGGCAKVREKATGIEKYPWIPVGIETFNASFNCFIVIVCEHYKKSPPQKQLSSEKIRHLKLSLAQFVWDDVTSQEEVRRRMSLKE